MLKKIIIVFGVLCLLQTSACLAAPTALNFIPIADVLDSHSFRLELIDDSNARLFDDNSENGLLLEWGPVPHLEIGADVYRTSDDMATLLNAKYALTEEKKGLPALSIGFQELGDNSSPSYYLTSAKAFGKHKLHAGIIGNSHTQQPLLGYEYDMDDNNCLMLDWQGGSDRVLGLGACHQFKSGPSVTFAYGWPNQSSGDSMVYLDLSWEWAPGEKKSACDK